MLPIFQLVAGFFFGFSYLAATYVHPLVPASSLVVWRGEVGRILFLISYTGSPGPCQITSGWFSDPPCPCVAVEVPGTAAITINFTLSPSPPGTVQLDPYFKFLASLNYTSSNRTLKRSVFTAAPHTLVKPRQIPGPPPSSSPAVLSTPSIPRPNLVANRTVPNLAAPAESTNAGNSASSDHTLVITTTVLVVLILLVASGAQWCHEWKTRTPVPAPASNNEEVPRRLVVQVGPAEPFASLNLDEVANPLWVPHPSIPTLPLSVAAGPLAPYPPAAPLTPPSQPAVAPPPPPAASTVTPVLQRLPAATPTLPFSAESTPSANEKETINALPIPDIPELNLPSASSTSATFPSPSSSSTVSSDELEDYSAWGRGGEEEEEASAPTLPPAAAPIPLDSAAPPLAPAPTRTPSTPSANKMHTSTSLPAVGPSGTASFPSSPVLQLQSSSSIPSDDSTDYSTWDICMEEEEEEVRRALEEQIEEEVEEQAGEEPQQQVAGVEPTTPPGFPPVLRESPPSPTDIRTVGFSFGMSSRVNDTFAVRRHGRASSSSSSLETVQSSGNREEEWEEEVRDEAQLEQNPLPTTPLKSTAGQLPEAVVPSLDNLRRELLAEWGPVSPARPARLPDVELADLSVSELLPVGGPSSKQQANSEAGDSIRNASATEILDADQQRQLEEQLQTQFILNQVHVARSMAQPASPPVADAVGPAAAHECGGEAVATSRAGPSATAAAERERFVGENLRFHAHPDGPLQAERSLIRDAAHQRVFVDRTPQGPRTRRGGAGRRKVEGGEGGNRVDENIPVGVSAKAAGKRRAGVAEVFAPVQVLPPPRSQAGH
ncbi:hypothetical protein DFH07DRAFT_89616 [Mycena maculata]|uniref:Uncharacterized protein n=1 Tax=Mycena maculata TaxID=230809 RepID=A0AAD7NUN2_9AGAR|nr:hypothetical protein DFH07DRAFT_89616 [Mycena maculata]